MPKKEEMWALYSKYYNYTRHSFFERILKNNHYALYIHQGRIVGFTGLRIQKIKQGLTRNLMIYFGQTVMESGYRGKSVFPFTGAKLLKKYASYLLFGRVYFWCDALTYKPYLIFAKTLNNFYPSHKEVMSPKIINLRNHLGRMHYGEAFCTESGIVHKTQKLVNDPSVSIKPEDLYDPDIHYYLQCNPGYKEGHGLLTMAPVSFVNLLLIIERAIRKIFGLRKKGKRRSINNTQQKQLTA